MVEQMQKTSPNSSFLELSTKLLCLPQKCECNACLSDIYLQEIEERKAA